MPAPYSKHTAMSHATTSAPEDTLDDLALRHALGTLEGAERKEFETCLGCPHSRASALATEYRDLVASVSMAAAAPVAVPPEVKERVFAAIRADGGLAAAMPPQVFQVIAGGDRSWMPTPYRGVRMCELSTASPDFAVLMLECQPGANFAPHHHDGAEDIYILSGKAVFAQRVLHAGDFMHSDAGTDHEAMVTPEGCLALVITSRKNYSPRAARAYGIAHRVVSRIGRALGVAAKS